MAYTDTHTLVVLDLATLCQLKTHTIPLNTYIHSSDDMFDVIFVNSLQAILEDLLFESN